MLLLALLQILAVFCENIEGTSPLVFYVSPSGSDTNAGTVEAPFLSLKAAIEQISSQSRPAEVHFAAGDYLTNQNINFIADAPCTIYNDPTSEAPVFTVSKSTLVSSGIYYTIKGNESTLFSLKNTEFHIDNCVFNSTLTDDDFRTAPIFKVSGGILDIQKSHFKNIDMIANSEATLFRIDGREPQVILAETNFSSISKVTAGAILTTTTSVMGGVHISVQFCKFLGCVPPVMGGGVFQLSSSIGNGYLTFTKCDFPRHYHVSGGVIFHQQRLTGDLNTDKFDDFIAFPVLPPSTEPAGGYKNPDLLDINNEMPQFYSSYISVTPSKIFHSPLQRQIHRREDELRKPEENVTREHNESAFRKLHSNQEGMPLTFFRKSLLTMQLPILFVDPSASPVLNPSAKVDESSYQAICGEFEGPVLHIHSPCYYPIMNATKETLSTDHVVLGENGVKKTIKVVEIDPERSIRRKRVIRGEDVEAPVEHGRRPHESPRPEEEEEQQEVSPEHERRSHEHPRHEEGEAEVLEVEEGEQGEEGHHHHHHHHEHPRHEEGEQGEEDHHHHHHHHHHHEEPEEPVEESTKPEAHKKLSRLLSAKKRVAHLAKVAKINAMFNKKGLMNLKKGKANDEETTEQPAAIPQSLQHVYIKFTEEKPVMGIKKDGDHPHPHPHPHPHHDHEHEHPHPDDLPVPVPEPAPEFKNAKEEGERRKGVRRDVGRSFAPTALLEIIHPRAIELAPAQN